MAICRKGGEQGWNLNKNAKLAHTGTEDIKRGVTANIKSMIHTVSFIAEISLLLSEPLIGL